MRVGFNARLLSGPALRGWNRYTVNLLSELIRQGVEPVLYSNRPIDPSHLARLPSGGYRVRESRHPMRLPAWEQAWLPARAALDRVKVLHSPFNFGIPWASRCPRVLTLHDAIDQVYYRNREPQIGLYHWIARRRAERIVTVSRFSRDDIVKHLGVPAEKIRVIYEAADPRFAEPVTEEQLRASRLRHALPARYVFYVGGWEARKNLGRLLEGFAKAAPRMPADVALVLAGGPQDPTHEDRRRILSRAERLGILPRLRLLGWIEDAELPALYAGALCFAYPSDYEGFGLQLVEAMAAGCPTLAARRTCLPEILGEGGETFDDASELGELLARVASDDGYRRALGDRARSRARMFSWEQAARETIEVYGELLSSTRKR